ncbi:MAG: hypothetical protein IIC91_07650 [Chloroflexi bacterium]|nr:hypothetical protein [Chloroflexota bacterium]
MSIEGILPILDPTPVFSVHKASRVLGWLKGLDPMGQRTRDAREDVSTREIARAMRRENWDVQVRTRVPGLSTVPDIVATLGNRRILVEVKTGTSLIERKRVNELRKFAENQPETNLRVIEATKPFGVASRARRARSASARRRSVTR